VVAGAAQRLNETGRLPRTTPAISAHVLSVSCETQKLTYLLAATYGLIWPLQVVTS